MPATERYQADVFGIIVLIASVLVVVFLVIAAIYFFNLMSLKPPSKGESTFLFWTSIVMVLVFVSIAIFALIRIFNHKSVVYEEPKTVVTTKTETAPVAPPVARPVAPPIAPVAPVAPAPIRLPSNIPKSARATNESVSVSDIPGTQTQNAFLEQKLLTIVDSEG